MDKQAVLRVLKGTEAWLSDPDHWCQYTLYKSHSNPRSNFIGLSRDGYVGMLLETNSFDKTCAMGSIINQCGLKSIESFRMGKIVTDKDRLLESTLEFLTPYFTQYGSSSYIASVNDGEDGYNKVMSILRTAITDLEAGITSSPTPSLPSGEKDQSEKSLIAV